VLAAALAALILAPAARAQDLIRNTIPQRWIEPLMVEDLPELKYPGYFDDLDKARAQSWAGRYKLSLVTLRKIHDPKPEQLTTIAWVKGNSLANLGRVDEALKALNDPRRFKLKDKPETSVADDPNIQLLRAQVLTDAGRNEESLALLHEVVKSDPDSWGGHYLLGSVSEQMGDLDTARAEYAWFVDAPREILAKWEAGQHGGAGTGGPLDSARDIVYFGRAVDRWAILNKKYANNNALPKMILNIFLRAGEIDPEYWPAHEAAAEYYLSHDDKEKAVGELKSVLAANPQDPGTLSLLGEIMLSAYDFGQVDGCVDALRKIDQHSPAADLLETRSLLRQHQPRLALEPVQRVLARQPKNIEALGLLAAVQALRLHDDEMEKALAEVDQIDVSHNNASAYLEVAEQLAEMWQYPRALAKYQIVVQRAPWLADALNGLGLLYTRIGEEDKAYATLFEARQLDPFNVATTNYMRLMDTMRSFTRVEFPHFTVVFDAQADPIIGEYVGQYMESVYAEVCGDFKYEPPRKTLLEVFPTTDSFSVRTTGMPGAETYGASFGPVMTAISPRKGATMGTFNWARVLRHEFTHVMNESATEQRCPRWLTEGLAVWEERVPFRFNWVPQALYQAAHGDKLFTIAELPNALIHPKKPHDGEMAYMEAFWIVRYLDATYGHDSVLKLLDGYKQAKNNDDAFTYACGLTAPQFEKAFFAWAKDQVAKWGYDSDTTAKYDKLKADAEKAKDAKDYEEAARIWEQVVEIRPLDLLPHQRLAGLYIALKQPDKAIEHLQTLQKLELSDDRYAKAIARIYKKDTRFDDAAKFALQAIYVDPYDLSAHELLRDVYQENGNADGLAREQRVIPLLEKWIEEQQSKQ